MGSSTLEPFLTGTPATVNITPNPPSTPKEGDPPPPPPTTWTYIVKKEQSEPSDPSISSVGNWEDVFVVSKEFWDLDFTSANVDKYKTFFGDGIPDEMQKLENTACVGDGNGSAVVLLDDAAVLSSPVTLGDLCTAFGISTKISKALEFIQKVGTSVQAPLFKGSNPPLANGVWYVTTSDQYVCTTTLSFLIGATDSTGPRSNAVDWLQTNLLLGLSPPTSGLDLRIPITFTKITPYPAGYQGTPDPLSSTYKLSYQFDIKDLHLSVDFTETDVGILLIPAESSRNASISGLISGINAPTAPIDLPGDSGNLFGSIFSHFYLQSILLKGVSLEKPTPLNWNISVLAGWILDSGQSNNAQPVVISLTYDSNSSTFNGSFFFQSNVPDAVKRRSSLYDHRLELPQTVYDDLNIASLGNSLNLWNLIQEQGNPPPIPTDITNATIKFESTTDDKKVKTSTVTFTNEIKIDPKNAQPVGGDSTSTSASDMPVPLGGFSWDDLQLVVTHSVTSETPPTKTTSVNLSQDFVLAPTNPNSKFTPATLTLKLDYSSSKSSATGDSSAWTLTGTVGSLSVGLLAGFFNNDCSTGAMAVLGDLTIDSLELTCIYGSKKSSSNTKSASTITSASSFLITGVLKLGALELDLSYQYVSSTAAAVGTTAAQQKWGSGGTPKDVTVITAPPNGKTYAYSFEAYLKVAGGSTIGSIAESIVPGSAGSIPDFVANITVSLKDPTDTPVKLRYRGDQNGSALVVYVAIDMFNLTFVQLRTKEDPDTKAATVKRILRVSVDQIPMMEDIPLVKELPQPFDHLIYLWVQDDSTVVGAEKGFTREEIEASDSADVVTINGELVDLKIPPIQRQEKPTPKPDDLELQDGHHFMIVTNGKVIVDHVFGASNKDPNPAPTTDSKGVEQPPTSDDPVPPTTGKTTTKAGALSLKSISLQFKDGQLHIGMDATLTLGPLSLSVVGFIVSIVMNDKTHPLQLNNLGSIIKDGLVSANIKGIDISLDKDPLTIAGGFEHNTVTTNGQTEDYFRGGVCVGLKAWKLLAIGQYSIVTVTGSSSQYRSVFIYGKLDGPLIELEFATISGVRLGFGYNSGVHNPDINQMYDFPFISDAGLGTSADDPMAVLTALLEPSAQVPVPFVYSKEGMGWFCMGMTITAFDCLTLTTVALMEIDTDPAHRGVIVTLFADGVFQMEPGANPDETLFYIEIIVSVEMNFIEGYIAANAALAPQSHVYVPQAHLSGQASFYSWFGNNPNAGDWVITIGGYHRAFQRPSYYPNPDRLRLSFVIGDDIQIVGEAYAAVTPKVAMIGGILHMSLSVGPVEAWCDLALDVFINFKPFYFVGHISLSVGCSFNIDVWFVHIHISVSLGADLTIWGPHEFGGNAYVDLWFFGFSIDFGSPLVTSSAVSLDDFYQMALKAGPGSTPPSTDTSAQNGPGIACLKFSVESGMFPVAPTAKTGDPYPSTGVLQEWQVEGGLFVFRIDVPIALTSALLAQYAEVPAAPPKSEVPEVDTTIGPTPPPVINSYPMHRPIDSSILTVRIHSLDKETKAEDLASIQVGFTAELVTKAVPSALWRAYDSTQDPIFNNSPSTLQTPDDATLDLYMALRVTAPPPVLAVSPIVEFDAVACMLSTILPLGEIPAIIPEDQSVLPQTYEPTNDNPTRWKDFGAALGTKAPTVQPMLDICADLLGWNVRAPCDAGTAVDTPPPAPAVTNPKPDWELSSDVPKMLASQVAVWYESLPMVYSQA